MKKTMMLLVLMFCFMIVGSSSCGVTVDEPPTPTGCKDTGCPIGYTCSSKGTCCYSWGPGPDQTFCGERAEESENFSNLSEEDFSKTQ